MAPKSSRGRAARASKDERALLLFSLLYPMHPDACCVIGLNDLLDRVFGNRTQDDSRQGPILRAAMAFISAKRSNEEHAALHAHLTTCQCKPRNRSSHGTVARPAEEILELVLFFICGTISDYFMRLGPGKLRTERDNVPPESQPWPSRVSDIIPTPGGESDVLSGLVQWAAVVPGGHSTFALIGALARFWEPFAMELFRTPEVFHLAIRHLRCAADAYDRRARPAEQIYRFISPVIACAEGLFFNVWEIDMTVGTTILVQMYEEMYAVGAAIESIIAGMREDNVPMEMDHSLRWFTIVRLIRPVINADGTFNIKNKLPVTLEEAKEDRTFDFRGAFSRMVEIRNRNQCLHILCTSKIHTRLALCGRCGIARYCSVECQQAAWAAPDLPHKAVCKQIKLLRAQVGLSDSKAWDDAVRDSRLHREPRAFADMALKRNADPQVAATIMKDIMQLTQARIRFVAEESEEEEVLQTPPTENGEAKELLHDPSLVDSQAEHAALLEGADPQEHHDDLPAEEGD